MLNKANENNYVVFLPNSVSLEKVYLKYENKYIEFSSNILDYLDDVYFSDYIFQRPEGDIIGSIVLLIDKHIFPRRYDYERYDDCVFTPKTHPMYIKGVYNERIEFSNLKIHKLHYPNESLHIHNFSDNSFTSVVSNRIDAIKYSKFAIKQVLSRYLLQNNIYSLHASAVSKENKGYIFMSGSHQGKSTIYSNLLCNGFEPINDDIVFWNEYENCIELHRCPIVTQTRDHQANNLIMHKNYDKQYKPIFNPQNSTIILDSVFWISKGWDSTSINTVVSEKYFKKALRSCGTHQAIPLDDNYLKSFKKLMSIPCYELRMSSDYNETCECFVSFLKTKY